MFGQRWREGRAISDAAFAVVKANRFLIGFPVRAGIASVVIFLVLGIPAAVLAALEGEASGPAAAAAIVLVLVAVFGSAIVVARFQGGLVAAADACLHGTESSYDDGMAAVRGRTGALAGWAAINATVGLVLSTLQSGGGQDGFIGIALRVLGALVSVAWAFVTFFVVPVIVFEQAGAIDGVKRSAALIRQRWGTTVSGVVRIGVRFAIFLFLPAIVLVAGGAYLAVTGAGVGLEGLGVLLVLVGALLFVAGAVVQTTVRSVFGVALYRWATEGEVIGPFSEEQLTRAAVLKGERRR